ncbi:MULTISPECIES: serine hydrolase [unclassified Phenylobacterium]|uniref:serine hydrolase domain-containing protein n=1 Tax=unclassified Phenylobacterium TaxID=2640670 RepID=UPI0022B4CE80|nr:serine hydrolase domain-containing protein [Phenylobacterium sp. NIBR 498073]WGU40602.1 serine hydrolase domain-containing protein [Phenylobacterium sp. NIBR 498073]
MGSQTIQALLDEAVANGAAPGLTAAIAHPDGTDSFHAAGVRGAADPSAMRPDDTFWIASCTKAITSAAALQLVERGVLDLDAPVGERLPNLASPQVLEGFDADGAPRLRPASTPLTLRRLLTHTSGLAYDFFHADLARYYASAGASLMESAPSAPVLAFDPGDGWQYGIGIDAVGWLVEQAAGQGLDAYVAEHVTGPLGMTDTAFVATPELEARAAGMHHRTPDGAFVPAPHLPASPVYYGGGGLRSTAPDYLKFLRAVIAEDGGGVLGPRTLRWLRDADSAMPAGDLDTAMAPISHDFRPLPGTPKTWTLGFLRNEADVPGMRRAGSLAWGGLANCYYWADPASGVAGVLCGQFLPFGDPGMLAAFEALERAVYAQ